MFIALETIPALDRQTDRQTDRQRNRQRNRQTDGIAKTLSRSACVACWRAIIKVKYVVCIDPEFSSSITVNDVRQRSATVSWSLTPSQTISSTVVRYQAASSSSWNPIDVSVTSNNHTVTGLQSGTEYQFQVIVTSHGKRSSSNIVEATTGKCFLLSSFVFIFLSWYLCAYG